MIGVDIERIDRFEHFTQAGYERIFSKKEIEYASQFENSLEHLCGFYCVKEAFVKALDDDAIVFKDIEVLHTESGKPYINRSPFIESILREHHRHLLDISISHCREYAVAVVLVE